MATKKSAGKKATGTEAATEKTAAKKAPAKETAEKKSAAKKTADLHASAPEQTTGSSAGQAAKPKPTRQDIEQHAYYLWERSGKKHGHHDQHWHQAEHELNS